MNSAAHFFFALTLPDEIKEELHLQCQELRKDFPFKKWLHRDDYHITLAFLGNASDTQRQEAVRLVENSLKNESSFNLTLAGTGIFGDKKSPRILWAGIEESDRLRTIQQKVYDACITAGFKLDKKPFTPHITLARKYTGEQFSLERLQQTADSKQTADFAATKVSLYQTHLGASPSYESIETIYLPSNT
ncbi:RNA 2',3'-cyclic phosphodiesterase [Peribacillus psychrosaccharolyticus]|uniref:RNA 2',3'-cyclic phosphodiesterase n=1 Tax=Peribacillus psychrosaccharolyticus TaxID=1407 RepID=A0A974NKS3_PERPY|nr:RNA 2',3'-cyclic phosphodiesterase [Peribacillus psychrosaccharolyticus]MEC2054787.1 RNA 2',3'-cyclic phosphodiesterase [Peribacillus psychrosaccharolyticus]MED3743987.1 RNA 2',3'-cyclic phosphodiesterase [Peribacillus psychrosaccharolyticus]QQS99489.1 RNA 2',3'-cyclic phosphodiesterase [Peribacillus psychrosaccharolyticus]